MKNTILDYQGPKNNCVNGYQHGKAQCHRYTNPIGSALRKMLEGWEAYANATRENWGQIGDDYFLGPEWEKIGHSLLALLNGELGGWDAGSLDCNIRRILKENGFED